MYSSYNDGALPPPGFPIRIPPDQSLFSGSPRLFAAYHVLHRLPLPRHPPYALISLTIKNQIQSINLKRNTIYYCIVCTMLYAISTLCNCQRSVFMQDGFKVSYLHKSCCLRMAFYLYPVSSPDSCGGGERDRTDDLLLARQALSQLSYTPDITGGPGWTRTSDLTIISRVL